MRREGGVPRAEWKGGSARAHLARGDAAGEAGVEVIGGARHAERVGPPRLACVAESVSIRGAGLGRPRSIRGAGLTAGRLDCDRHDDRLARGEPDRRELDDRLALPLAGVKARGLRSDRQALSLSGVPRREWRAGRGGRVGRSPAAEMGAAAHLRRLGRLGAVHADADAGASIRGAGLPASVSTALGPSLHSRAGLTGVARGEEQRELAVPRRRPDRLRSGPASPAAQMEAAAGHGTARAGVKARGLRSARQSRSPAPRMGGNGGRGHESRARNGGARLTFASARWRCATGAANLEAGG